MTLSETRDIDLGDGASANVNDERLLVNLPSRYVALSSAVMNGGLVGSINNSSSSTDNDGDERRRREIDPTCHQLQSTTHLW